ncbi:MAG: HAD family hydrolase [Clostridia bacterium]|nr:HAD family hydrolase [Clostridia bacterium]
MKYRYIFFDLDGTLTDPGLGITNSVQYALRQFGIDVQDRRELYPFIGPPLSESFVKFYGFTEEQAQEAVTQYRVYFADTGIFENSVYPGIPELLKALNDAGMRPVLATSKPAVFAERILEHFDLKKFFHFVSGSELNGARVEKADVIRFALDALSITDLSEVIMVGDRCFDVEGAAACGLPAIGVLYGYGDEEELRNAAAIAKTVADLRELLL